MPENVIIVQKNTDFKWSIEGLIPSTQKKYITEPESFNSRIRVINLSRNYSYLGSGYYCSLLAEARGQKVLPTVKTIMELSQKSLYKMNLPELNTMLQRRIQSVQDPPSGPFFLYIFFGQADDYRFQGLAHRIFDLFRSPALKVSIRRKEEFFIHSIKLISINELKEEQLEPFQIALKAYTRSIWRAPRASKQAKHNLAILYNPREHLPPSDARALNKFCRIGEELNFEVELIQKKDFGYLTQYDALFIRETTAIDNHTFVFARKAELEGMPVIDDPASILRCTNKVFLAELMRLNKIAIPQTIVLERNRLGSLQKDMSFPIILKIPDSSFSRGIYKVENEDELVAAAEQLFDDSDYILAQEFMYTEFDWRVGILNGKPLFVCKYNMADKHWQIIKHGSAGRYRTGNFETIPIDDAPHAVINTAIKAASLIGKGLYGVDLKQTKNGVYIIEVNDNPNIDQGVEDLLLKDELYKIILREFLSRIEGNK